VLLRRSLAALTAAALALVAADRLGAELIASAIAHAPNSDRVLSVAGSHPPPAPADVEDFVYSVGPPDATLDSWILPPARHGAPKGTLILLHGIRMDKSSLLGFARRFSSAGFRTVLPDLRGHGSSTGSYLTYGVVESRDAVQLIDGLERRFGSSDVALFGYSYGGAVAIQTAARDPRVKAVAAVSTFASLRQVVSDYKHNYFSVLDPIVPAAWLQARVDEAGLLARFDPDEADPARAAGTLRAPLLLIHGTSDTQIPSYHAQELGRSANRATLVLLEGETHASMLHRAADRVAAEVLAFLERDSAGGSKARQ
jgi:pimeloyl-ACP methyl ester carboxylesterase